MVDCPSDRELKLAPLLLALLALLAAFLLPVARAAEPKQVLIIHSFGRDFSPFTTVASTFRTELSRQVPGSVVYRETALEAERPPEQERPYIDFLLQSYDGGQPDLVARRPLPGQVHPCSGRSV